MTTTLTEMEAVFARARESFIADGPPDADTRRDRIDRLVALVVENSDAFVDALIADFGSRSAAATLSTEIVGMLSGIEHTRASLESWMRPRRVMRAATPVLDASVVPSPLGVVGIIGPWNFPLHLVVFPAAAAFAAGNRVMIKMSEITAHTAALFAELAPRYFDETELAVVTGDVEVAQRFSALTWDHLFFTGSPAVGRRVAVAAAHNLVPVTLELGGKNPVVVADGADIERAAQRIALGRMVNGGQVCICPEHVFVPESAADDFADRVLATWQAKFPTIVDNPEYTASVNAANHRRVSALVDDARERGARVDTATPAAEALPDAHSEKIAPTLIRDIDDTMEIAQEEIFGPVLMMSTYRELDEVIGYLAARPAPLVAYWFGDTGAEFDRFVANTRSGAVARNEFGIHMLPTDVPFGGVGNSGTGAYHGKAGFDTFSHQRSVVGTDLPFMVTTSSAVGPLSPTIRTGMNALVETTRLKTRWRLARRSAKSRRTARRDIAAEYKET